MKVGTEAIKRKIAKIDIFPAKTEKYINIVKKKAKITFHVPICEYESHKHANKCSLSKD